MSAPLPPAAQGLRLDKALLLLPLELSRAALQRLITQGRVALNGQTITSASHKVQAGQHARVELPPPEPCRFEPEAIPLDVLYEDDDLIVINKPVGMVTHPGAGINQGTLVNALLHHCGAPDNPYGGLSGIGGTVRPGIVHRLDKETSGVMVAAKHDAAHVGLAKQFEQRTLTRFYVAIVQGAPQPARGRVEAPIGRHPVQRKKMAVVAGGKFAATRYKTLKAWERLSLIQCKLESGRTHQIRVHMAHIGHPLLGDSLYGRPFHAPKAWPDASREALEAFAHQALHAAVLGFTHPISREALRFETPPPADFLALIRALDNL
ncbi:putative ribosomal large subunit pseudouridine synthase D [Magnetofaba australis IT-1]|uniref:Pseudouridine synthase n=1 Tax=Magnetofaba australis IT-1 TaxID=1434232 RepID=A0A1Y2K6F6_9PROT|nr:putative ribosomal large subunit pseudouridine synthase D [Magnetofaba australis IT-1]